MEVDVVQVDVVQVNVFQLKLGGNWDVTGRNWENIEHGR